MRDVVGIGNAIVDVLAHKDDSFLELHSMVKGSMTLIDDDRALDLYHLIRDGVECSGGSAANTMAGLASLGGDGAYIGKVRNDPLGDVFRREIRGVGVSFDTAPAGHGAATGRCIVVVTPDAQRTMHTFLGASATLGPDDIDETVIRDARITFLEGYLWDPEAAKQAFLAAAKIAHDAGRKVALTLSDPFCVDRHRESFCELVEHHVDVLLANEQEVVSLYETRDLEAALARLAGKCEIAAVTRGADGCVVLAAGERYDVPAEPVDKVVDTTGAGDLFASGFLLGVSRGREMQTCARLGGIAAAEIISHFGARPETSLKALADERLGSPY